MRASLRIAKDSTGNKVLAEAIEKSAENIKAGDSLAKPLGASHHFPRDIVEMVAVGEESNNLEKVLLDISSTLEKRTTRQLDLFVRLLEPAMLLVMALHWPQTEALFGFGHAAADFSLGPKQIPRWGEVIPPAAVFIIFVIAPYAEELWRGGMAKRVRPHPDRQIGG